MRILMVCLGNICRSPLAEGIMHHKVNERGLDWDIQSAGTSAYHQGEAPDRRSQAVAFANNIDITKQRARQFSPYDLEQFDIIYAMDKSNYRNILALAQTDEERAKVRLIMNELYPGQDKEVPDPYYDSNGFEQVYNMLNAACEMALKRELGEEV